MTPALFVVAPLTPLMMADYDLWFDDTCTDGETCLLYSPNPKVIPGSTDRTVFLTFYHPPGELQTKNSNTITSNNQCKSMHNQSKYHSKYFHFIHYIY